MKELVVVSGKGGTGKTSFTASFAQLSKNKIALGDCDVDAANLALLMPGDDQHSEPFFAGQHAKVDEALCTGCAACSDVCRYNAIQVIDNLATVKKLACEGCRSCSVVCPTDAITFKDNQAGTLFTRETSSGPMIYAELGIAQDNSGKLVAEVRKQTIKAAENQGIELAIFDGPPGIGCPVHAAIGGVHLIIAVTEPSSSGLHDLERMIELSTHFNLRTVVIINKYDLSPATTKEIELRTLALGSKVIGKIHFDERVPKVLSQGLSPLAVPAIKEQLEIIWQKILKE